MERKHKNFIKQTAALAGAIALLLLTVWVANAASPDQVSDEVCLTCHSNRQMVTASLKGERIPLFVDKDTLDKSVHGKQLSCVGCHSDIESYPHPLQTIPDKRAYAIEKKDLCKKCHSVEYQQASDSMHANILLNTNQNAPVCTDCHGYHDVSSPDTPRTRVSQTCAKCHQPIYDAYKGSVHGKALEQENNADVPVCTDCHGIHNIKAAANAAFRIESPEICAGCHTNKDLMAKYGISSQVYQTFRQEFHGMTAQLYQINRPMIIWRYKAVCVDCHGVHDIKKPDDPASSVNTANLAKTCGKCHEGASVSFTQAWTEHKEPAPDANPISWGIQMAYYVIIPATIGGMVVHIGFDWFRARERKRKESEHEPY